MSAAIALLAPRALAHGADSGCTGPTALVTVTVDQQPAANYAYRVTNLHKSPVTFFVLGDGDRPAMQATPGNTPMSVAAPEGWKGQAAPIEETVYMHVFWKPKKPEAGIAPGASLEGFKLEMPPPPKSSVPLYHSDGTPVRLLDMHTAPFVVVFGDGTCVWGTVGAEGPGKK